MRDVVREAIAEEQITRHFGVSRVPVRRGVEFEKVEDGERGDELGQSPDAVVVDGEVGGA